MHLSTFLTASAVALSVSAAAQTPAPSTKASTAAATSVFLPQKEESYSFDNSQWVNAATTTHTYDKQGRLLTTTVDNGAVVTRTTYTYDGLTTSQLREKRDPDDTEWTPEERLSNTFDARVTYYPIHATHEVWDAQSKQWKPKGYNYKNIITRDAKGNVTQIETRTFNGEEYLPYNRTVITYGADGTATDFVTASYNTETAEWTEQWAYHNITWYTTDGQLLEAFSRYYSEPSEAPTNRLKSAEVSFKGNPRQTIAVTRIPGREDFTATTTAVDGTSKTVTLYLPKDANGSYDYVVTSYYDADGDGNFTDEEKMIARTSISYDEQGNQTYYGTYGSSDYGVAPTFDGGMRYTYTYDAAKGNAKTSMIAENVKADADGQMVYQPKQKVTYSDFAEFQTTGIAAAPTVGTATATAVYDLSGRRRGTTTEGLPAGLYIVRSAAGTQKVIVR